jgi:NTP pyrophosphatase (non-canonical NTP hydrolase)
MTVNPADQELDLSWRMRVAAGVNDLKRAVHQCAFDHGWWPKTGRNMGEMIALMHSELSEALEAWRDPETTDPTAIYYEYDFGDEKEMRLEPTYTVPGHSQPMIGKPCGIASEFADVIIRILDTCEMLNIPITRALIEKHSYNLTRPYRHGGKLA